MHTHTHRAINRKLRVCLHMQIHNISPSCQLPLFFQPLSLPRSHLTSPLQLPSCLSSPLSDRILITLLLPPRLLLSLHLKFLFLQKLIFLINFLCLNSLSSSLCVTHRLLLPPLLFIPPSLHCLGQVLFGKHPRLLGFYLPLALFLPSCLTPVAPPTCSPSLPRRQL